MRAILAPLVLAAMLVAAPAHAAGGRVDTTTMLRVLPGADRAEFHNGDPIKLCYGTLTERLEDGTAVLTIEQRVARRALAHRRHDACAPEPGELLDHADAARRRE